MAPGRPVKHYATVAMLPTANQAAVAWLFPAALAVDTARPIWAIALQGNSTSLSFTVDAKWGLQEKQRKQDCFGGSDFTQTALDT